MRIACLQLNPVLGKVLQNIARANLILDASIARLDKPFDLLVLPELALTGYNFPTRSAITPWLEPTAQGPTSDWARAISAKYQCFTLVGYPEWSEEHKKIFNAAIMTAPDGSTIHHYRKTFLYEADEAWGCSENPSGRQFELFELVLNKDYYLNGAAATRLVTCNIGICMDLNPYKFELPFNRFEFASACFLNRARLILCPMAWLLPLSPSIAEDKTIKVPIEQEPEVNYNLRATDSANPDSSTVDYWVLRFLPFLRHPMVQVKRYYEKVTLVCCNRSGQEGDVLYAGSSLILQFDSQAAESTETGVLNPSLILHGSLDCAQEGILVRDIEV
jgi:protein N-terminal amidase